MLRTSLEVVNACLATMWEAPLNTLEDDHSFKAAALLKINESNLTEQKRGFWFNSEYIKLVPDVVGSYIYIPTDAIAVKTVTGVGAKFVQRGRRLYDPINNTYVWTAAQVVDLVRAIPFDDLPFHAADCISAAAVLAFQRDYDADGQRFQQLGIAYTKAFNALIAEDMRNVRPNFLATKSNVIKMGRISGLGPRNAQLPWTPGWPK